MDILHVNKFYHPQIGGIERVVKVLAEHASARGHDVRVLASMPRGLGRTRTIEGVPVVKAASAGVALSQPIAPTFPIHLARHARGADVVHHHLPNPIGVVSHLVGAPAGTPTVAYYHSDIVRQATALRAYRPMLHRFLQEVDRIVVASPAMTTASEHLGPFQEKCTVIPYSVDLDAIDSLDTANAGVDVDGPVVLFVGRLVYYKGVEHLIEAMAQVEATLLVVGDGPRREALGERAEALGIQDRVRFLGSLSERELHACYALADVFALPSVEPSEAFGIVQIEAMAHGTPVVNTDLPTGVPWVSKDGVTGLTVPPGDAASLADGLNELLGDAGLRESYGRNARRRVEETFSRDSALSQMYDLYRTVTR